MCLANDSLYRMQIKSEPLHQMKSDVADESSLCPMNNKDDPIAEYSTRHSSRRSSSSSSFSLCCDNVTNDDSGDKTNETSAHPKSPPTSATTDKSAIQPSSSFHCDLCGRVYFRKYSIEAHLRKHCGLMPYSCAECDATFARFDALRGHRLRKHSVGEDAQYACDYAGCTKRYVHAQFLREHVRRKHLSAGVSRTKRPGLVCETCGLSYPSPSKLAEHRYQHQDPATWPHACDLCPKRYIAKGTLQTHRKRHFNVRNFACSQCEARCFSRAELEQHVAYHNTERTEECQRCAKKYTTRSESGFITRSLVQMMIGFLYFVVQPD